VFGKKHRAKSILLRPALRDFGGQVASAYANYAKASADKPIYALNIVSLPTGPGPDRGRGRQASFVPGKQRADSFHYVLDPNMWEVNYFISNVKGFLI